MAEHRGSTHSPLSCTTNTRCLKVTLSTIVQSPIQTAFGSIFLFECHQTTVFQVVELSSDTPSLTEASHRVAGEAALSTSTLYYVTGGNTRRHTHLHAHTVAPRLSLSFSLSALRVHAGALPFHILYIWLCALKLKLCLPALFPDFAPLGKHESPYCTSSHRGELAKTVLERRLCRPRTSMPTKRLQSCGTNGHLVKPGVKKKATQRSG